MGIRIAVCLLSLAACASNSLGREGRIPGDSAVDQCEGSKRPDPGVTCAAFILMPSIPVSFGRLELGDKPRLGPALTLGLGGTFAIGKIQYVGLGEATFDPGFYFGAAVDVGAVTDSEDPSLAAMSLAISGFVGLGKVGVSVGYDVLTEAVFVGVSTNVSGISLTNAAYTRLNRWGTD